MDINLLVKLTSRAWSLSILGAMNDGTPGRQAPLLSAVGAGRTAFVQSMAHLIELGLIERNPGHGHPLRPEFRLTDTGASVAPLVSEIIKTSKTHNDQSLMRRSWTIPLVACAGQPVQFSQLRTALYPITDRALSQSLKGLTQAEWLARKVETDATPPRPLYHAINAGAAIHDILHAA